jgi:hypothetical protein
MRLGSVMGAPSLRLITQPSGIGRFSNWWVRIAPLEVTEVAMSSTTGASLPAGIATASGLVPSSGSVPPHGAMCRTLDCAP